MYKQDAAVLRKIVKYQTVKIDVDGTINRNHGSGLQNPTAGLTLTDCKIYNVTAHTDLYQG